MIKVFIQFLYHGAGRVSEQEREESVHCTGEATAEKAEHNRAGIQTMARVIHSHLMRMFSE